MQCKICKKNYNHLGSHLWHAHKIKARAYKIKFGLDLNYPLTSPTVQQKQKEAFKRNPVGLKNLTTQYQFKKGEQRVKTYYSRASKIRIQKQYDRYLKKDHKGQCPLCNQKTQHLFSHLYNAHGILVISRDKFNSYPQN